MSTTEAWQAEFLKALGATGNVKLACFAAKVARSTPYKAREADEAFAEAWADALADGTDVLEAEARKRALAGSDGLLMFLLKGHRREVFGDRLKAEHSGELRVRVEYDDIEPGAADNPAPAPAPGPAEIPGEPGTL